MNEVVLHIGMHKTGTTSIQQDLAGHDDGRVRMAQLGDANHSIAIMTVFSANAHEYHVHAHVGRSRDEVLEMRARLQLRLDEELSLDRDRLLICGEDMSVLEPQAVKTLQLYLSDRCDRVRVLAYVREPVSFASSALQQYVQGGMREFRIPTPDYRARFEKFIDCFGRDTVEFVLYDRQTMAAGSVVADFRQRTGLPSGNHTIVQTTNRSLSRHATRLIYQFNRDGVASLGSTLMRRARRELLDRLRELYPGPGFSFTPAQVMAAADVADIQWMESVSGLNLGLQGATLQTDDSLEDGSIDAFLRSIEDIALDPLRAEVAHIDPLAAETRNPLSMLNFLYFSIYFRHRYIRNSENLVETPARLRLVADKVERGHAIARADLKALIRVACLWRPKFYLKFIGGVSRERRC